jgi:hypothetical protein
MVRDHQARSDAVRDMSDEELSDAIDRADNHFMHTHHALFQTNRAEFDRLEEVFYAENEYHREQDRRNDPFLMNA